MLNKIPTTTHKGYPAHGRAYGNAVMVGFENVFILSSNAKITKLSMLPNNL